MNNDGSIRYKGHYYQLKRFKGLPRARSHVLVREYLDKGMVIIYKDKPIKFSRIPTPEKQVVAPASPSPIKERKVHKPAKNHPWRKQFLRHKRQVQLNQLNAGVN